MENLNFLFITLFIKIYSQIKENPIPLDRVRYPIVLSTEVDDYYYVMTDMKDFQINKISGEIVDTSNNILISLNKIYFADNSYNNYYINYESKECFLITYNPFSSSRVSVNSLNIEGVEKVNIISSIGQDNDFIIYGYYNDQLFFSCKSQDSHSSIQIEGINDKLSCKFIADEDYVCAIIIETKINLFCLKYEQKESLRLLTCTINFETYSNISEFALYDTKNDNKKLICLKQIDNVKCDILLIEYSSQENIVFNLKGEKNIIFDNPYEFSEKSCYFSEFNSEFLFCCAGLGAIYCFGFEKDSFDLIKYYKLYSPGKNSYLTIKNNNDFITFFLYE